MPGGEEQILKGVSTANEWPYESYGGDTGVLEARGHAQREPKSKAFVIKGLSM